MKIVSRGGTLSTEEYLEKKKRARRKKLLIILAIVLSLIIVLVLISRVEKLRVHTVTVSGANVIGADTVSNFSKEFLNGYYLWLVPKNNIFIYPHSGMEEALLHEFPRFSSVDVSLSGSKELSISVVEREPYALYCGESIVTESSTCYFLDKEGFIFDLAPAFSQGVYFVYASAEAIPEPRGKQFLPPDEFHSLRQFIENLPKLGITPLTLKLSLEDYDLTFSRDAHVLWKRNADIANIYSNLGSFLESDAIKREKDFISRVSLLDLRTENKVFYRFRE